MSPKIESHEPLGLELSDFIGAIRDGRSMDHHTALARDVVRIVEAADRSVREGGREISLDRAGVGPVPTPRDALALT